MMTRLALILAALAVVLPLDVQAARQASTTGETRPAVSHERTPMSRHGGSDFLGELFGAILQQMFEAMFEAVCEGVLTLGDTMLIFRSENAWENWAFFLDGDVREIARNRLIGNHVSAFHVTVPNRNFNFSYIKDGQAGADSTELIAIVRAAMDAERP